MTEKPRSSANEQIRPQTKEVGSAQHFDGHTEKSYLGRLWDWISRLVCWQDSHPPHILVKVATSSRTLSKSGAPPFSITLEANVDWSRAITICTHRTLLSSRMNALDFEGLAFRDTTTGELAARIVLNVCYMYNERGLPICHGNSAEFAELPSINYLPGFMVKHTFHVPTVRTPGPGEVPLSFEEELEASTSQTAGFIVGHEYEIELGQKMSSVSWWQAGSEDDVLADGQRRGLRVRARPHLPMVLVNSASFTLVD